jgi:hypothetical protein
MAGLGLGVGAAEARTIRVRAVAAVERVGKCMLIVEVLW